MNKIKDLVRVYGLYLVIAIVFTGFGFFWGRFNIIIVSESQWHEYVQAEQAVKTMLYEEELEQNLIKLYE